MIRFHLPDDGFGENAARVDIRWVMSPNPDAMPAKTATDGHNGLAPIRTCLGKHERQNHAFGGMATRVAEALLQLARGQARVERVRSRALPVLFRCVGGGGSILLDALEKSH